MAVHNMILRSSVSGVTLTSNITAGAGSLTYTGNDVFAAGDLMAIDNELFGVGAVNTTNNTMNLFRARLGTTAAAHTAGAALRTVESLSIREIVSTAEETASGQDIIDVWAPSGTLNQAAHASNKFMINSWRTKTIDNLKARDSADEQAAFNQAKADADAAYSTRYPEQE